MKLPPEGQILVLLGPQGCGKTTRARRLLEGLDHHEVHLASTLSHYADTQSNPRAVLFTGEPSNRILASLKTLIARRVKVVVESNVPNSKWVDAAEDGRRVVLHHMQ